MITRKRSLFLFPLLLTVFAVCVLTACKEEKTFRIGISQCSDDDWRKKMNDEVRRELFLHDNVEVVIRSADDNSNRQINDIHYFADNGFDMIIVAPNEADALTPVIKEVYDRGIPVLVFDRDIHGDSYTAFQGADNVELGHNVALLLRSYAEEAGRPIKVIEITGLPGSTPARGRHSGFVDAKTDDVIIAGSGTGNWNAEDAEKTADSLLILYPDVDVIYAHNDRMAIAAAEVAQRKGLDEIRIVGIDAAPTIGIKAVADGVIDATFVYPTEGATLVRTALDILEGRDYKKKNILPANTLVNASNASVLLQQNTLLEDETAKIVQLKERVDEYWGLNRLQNGLLLAAIIIVLLIAGVLFAVLRAYWTRKRHQRQLADQNKTLEEQRDKLVMLNEQLNDATQSKLMFFTNVSHDLRTPLTLIAGPVEQLSEADNLTPEQKASLNLANKNIHILHRLINQILDFRKYENGKLKLNLSPVEMGSVLAGWCDMFRNVAVSRDIRFTVSIDPGSDFVTALDVEKVERVMFNLISNAFKYTKPNGSINVSLTRSADTLIIAVTDTGKGISAEDLSHIFERFFQVEKVHPNGSGIGLSLAKAFIELHEGTLEAVSEPGKGSTFTVTLPVRHIEGQAATAAAQITAADVNLELGDVDIVEAEPDRDKTTVLVIDDNPDIRTLITSILNDRYTVLTAPDGARGIKMAAKYVPDLIICDVMMPVMDGLECCRRLKNEQATSHIPVLMLTACSMDEQRIQGYECGADAYLSKPFNTAVLRTRCESLIVNRRRIMSLMPVAAVIAPAEKPDAPVTPAGATALGPIDNDFYARFVEQVNKRMADPELTVDSIAADMGLGRTQFYRKIKAISGYSPVELLRNLRLAKARSLLTSTDKTVAEIAYEVGFSAPAYFGKCFKDRYHETPGDLRANLNR